jgi:hypothetical protein
MWVLQISKLRGKIYLTQGIAQSDFLDCQSNPIQIHRKYMIENINPITIT